MRCFITIGLLVLLLGALAPGCGSSKPPPRSAQEGRDEVDFSALPSADNRDALMDLNRRQRIIVRRARNSCGSIEEAAMGSAGCVISFADSEVAKADEAPLLAFHYALPPQWRYDPERPNSIGMHVHRYVPESGSKK